MKNIIHNLKFSNIIKLNKYKLFIFDCDGVMWTNYDFFPPAEEAISLISSLNKYFLFLTNNNILSTKSLHKKLVASQLMKDIVEESQIFNSQRITSRHIKNHHPSVKKLYIIGLTDIVKHFRDEGFEVIGSDQFNDKYDLSTDEIDDTCLPDDDIDGVVIAYDEKINYYKLTYALRILKSNSNKEIIFYGTNHDCLKRGRKGILPATYSGVSYVETCSGRKANVVTKPNFTCYDDIISYVEENCLLGNGKINKEEVIMIGDNLETDIKFANNIGIDSVLVYTGVHQKENLSDIGSISKYGCPTYVVDDLS